MENESMPDEQEIVARANALIPTLKARAERTEADRMVSRETIDEFRKAGIFKILQPKRWGGWQMSPAVYYKVLMELGRGCGSSAWDAMVLGIHQWEFGIMDPRAGNEVWGSDNSVLTCSSYAPWGQCKRVEGGWVLNGTWRTSSGCDHAKWAFVGAVAIDEKGQPLDRLAFLVSDKDYTIEDDWHVFGLAGTGSKSLVVKDAFVPDYRVHSQVTHADVGRFDPIYRIPFYEAFFFAVSSVIIGMAQGAIDEFTDQMKVRSDISGRSPILMSPYVRDRLGNAVARVRASRARVFSALEECSEYTASGECVPINLRVHHMLDAARCGRECEEATLSLFKSTGARGMYLSNRMQLILRNVIAGAQHITQNADDTAGWLGGHLLGQPLPPLLFEVSGAA
jgi:3-hydroxy-9,10-secoandrosta-1,3,5(10)-triene-9,17-dione monooxygenase